MASVPDPRDDRRRALELFAMGAEGRVPSGHAAGQVVAVLPDAGTVIIDFGGEFTGFRYIDFPRVTIGDFITVGPAVSRWRITPKETRRAS